MSEPFSRARQDRGGYDAPEQAAGPGREDPLAELARLVGKDDPFRALARQPGSNVAPFPHSAQARPAASYAPEHDGFHDFDAGHQQEFDAELRGSLEGRHHDPAHDDLRFPPVENEAEAFEPALGYPAAGGRGEAPTLNADLWAEGALPQAGPTGDLFGEHQPEVRDTRAPRRTLVVLAAVVVLTVGGLGATFLMHDGSGVRLGGGAPPTIMAAETPVKVQSPDVASGSAPDGNTALLEKTGSDKVDNAKVVTNNEQPVDLNQLPKSTSGQADAAPQTSSPSPFPEPRKVKTVLIRPDGSVVGEAAQAAAPAVAPPIGMVLPTEAGGPAQPTPAAAVEPVAKPSTPKSTARASATPTSPAAAASGAKSPATAPHPAKPVAMAAAATDDAAPTPAAAPGTWSVQLGAPPSEQEAKDMSSRLQKKFAGDLGGLKPGIVKADKDGKSIYRVRVGNLAQADAKALCTKLQGNGGSCFVVRN